MIDEGDCGAIGGMKIGRGNRSTRRKPAPTPLFPPQIPLDQTRARTRAAAVGKLQTLSRETALKNVHVKHGDAGQMIVKWGLCEEVVGITR
jgi:hypothetical protein